MSENKFVFKGDFYEECKRIARRISVLNPKVDFESIQLTDIYSIPLCTRLSFGWPDNYYLLPLLELPPGGFDMQYGFYIVEDFTYRVIEAQVTAGVIFSFQDNVELSGGSLEIVTQLPAGSMETIPYIQTSRLRYEVNGNTAGSVMITARVTGVEFRITGQ